MRNVANEIGGSKLETLPMVSVVIPAYKMEKYIGETIESVLKSSYPNFEVLVVDDGSPDRSYLIANEFAAKDSRVRVFTKPNGGVSTARNLGISLAKGELILPVDADNIVEPLLIEKAVQALMADPGVKLVSPTSDFFGEKTGSWDLPPFSLSYLARENMIDNCALYRKSDWEAVGGYCEEITTREDWAFWISLLKDGGKVVRLPEVLHHYRVRKNSKRVSQRCNKKKVIDKLNQLHPEFFERMLSGHLHHTRSLSKISNMIYRFFHPRKIRLADGYDDLLYETRALPAYFRYGSGKAIPGEGDNVRELRWKDMDVVARSFEPLGWGKRLVYGVFRKSEARRAFEDEECLLKEGVCKKIPLAYYEERLLSLFLLRSYFVSKKSDQL